MDVSERFDRGYASSPQMFNTPPVPVVVAAVEAIAREAGSGEATTPRAASTGRALDLGVGNGRHAKYLLDSSLAVVGVDSSQEGLRILREAVGDNPDLKLVRADVREFRTDEQFDLVVAVGLLHFLEREESSDLLERMLAWTRPGGAHAVAVRMTQNPAGNLPHVFAAGELRSVYESAGWRVEQYHESGGQQHRVASVLARRP